MIQDKAVLDFKIYPSESQGTGHFDGGHHRNQTYTVPT
jgi:hypothetical protein